MENKRNYRLNNQQRHAILRDYKAKHKVRDIAARYSICPSYVSTLARRYGCTMRRSDMSKRNRELVRARDDGLPVGSLGFCYVCLARSRSAAEDDELGGEC